MAVNFLKRYIWLIDLINRRGYISFREISEAWSRSPLNDNGSALSERTFFNHKTAIEEMLGIEIKNDRTMGYYIRGEEVGDNATLNWMLHSLCMNNLFQENSDMKDRIFVENVPSSEKFLSDIISAMRSGRVIQISYKSFYRPEATFFSIEPYCVKLFKQRWYVLGKSELGLRIYALDRIEDMEELDEPFTLPKKFDPEEYFKNFFGVIVGNGQPAQDVLIRVVNDQTKYLDTLPLHSSQQKIEEKSDDTHTVYRYRLVPTFDFKQELLRLGPSVEVLAPEELRDEMVDDIRRMAENYKI